MTAASAQFRESVRHARERWNDGRQIMRKVHQEGAPGRQVVHAMSDLLDHVLRDLFRSALVDFDESLKHNVAVVLHGGCGRREVAPFSDVDLMLLYQGALTDELSELSRRIAQDITDTGLQLGFSMRTPRDACGMSLSDPATFSSLTESRYLAGSVELYSNYLNRFQRLAQRRSSNLIRGIVKAREQERSEFGERVNVLHPNVKKSRGGLRDLHLIRWLGFVQFGESDFDQLCRRKALLDSDASLLHASGEFLLRIRNELHFHAGRANDRFDRNEQVRIAEVFGYRGDDAVLPVERLMQNYFGYSSQIQYICDHFVAKSLSRRTFASNVLAPLVTRQIDEKFHVGPKTIGMTPARRDELSGDLREILRLMQLANIHRKEIDYGTWESIRESMNRKQEFEITREIAEQFMALLANTSGLADLLQVMHEMFVLQKIIPDFAHARNLLQFNEYHKYTVDEHSLQAIRIATDLETDSTVCSQVYRNLKDKNILHLALLLHDVGKGYPEDHCEVGRRIAESIGKRLYLGFEKTEDIKFLVHNHLVMTHLAFHRDINDQNMTAEFASNVGSVRLLSMLYVLTCADVQAVGPGVLTPWKYNLLTALYQNARFILTGQDQQAAGSRLAAQLREEIASHGGDEDESDWLRQAAGNLPGGYSQQHQSDEVARQLLLLRSTVGEQVQCWVKPCSGSDLIELCIGKRQSRRSGTFYRMLGMLASLGLAVRSADIKSIAKGLVLYWFKFDDTEFDEPPASRIEDIRQRAIAIAKGTDSGPPAFRSLWGREETVATRMARPRVEVKIDNQTVDSATIIDVFAYQKIGLLYRVSRQIHQLKLDVSYARISNYARQLIAVFYVTDEQGSKIRNRNQLQVIKQEIYRTAKDYLEPPVQD